MKTDIMVKLVKFLTKKGYKEYVTRLNKEYERTFQKVFYTEQGKKFIDISIYDMSDVTQNVINPYMIEVGMCFDTNINEWINCKYYTLTPESLMKNCDTLQNKLMEAFDVLNGIPQS